MRKPGQVLTRHLRSVLARQLGPSSRLTQRSTLWPDRDPGVVVDLDFLDHDDQHIPALGSVDPDRPGDRVGHWWNPIEPRPLRRNCLVVFGLDEAVAGIERLNLEPLARLDTQQGFIAPVESKLTGQISRNALHGCPVKK